MVNKIQKFVVRKLIESRLLIVDPGDEEDVDNFFHWLYSDNSRSITMKKIIKIVACLIGMMAIICIALTLICNQIVVNNADGKTFFNIDNVKYNKVGLLLGTTPQARIGRITNYFFIYRIDAAEQLYKAGKIEQILISGDDNSLDGVNETECMRDSLVARGVPANAITLDGKGYRTICSVVNANKVYGLKSFTIISQKFHNERAIYQAEHLGLDVENIQGFNAKMPKSRRAFLTTIREYFARVKMFVDLCFTDSEEVYQQNAEEQKKWKSVPCPSRIPKAFADSLKKLRYEADSFIVSYRQLVYGYRVKAVVKLAVSDVDIISADLIFTKGAQSFRLHTQCFGDTAFCKGRIDYKFENPKLFRKYKNKTIEANYYLHRVKGCQMPMYTPFFFMDLDFDGIDELVIVHNSMAVRYHDGYDVYRIVDGVPFLINYPPYNNDKEEWGFGMTDYPEFDFKKRTISCPYPEGPGGLGYEGRIIYGVSKKQKDTIVVKGNKHYFHHIEFIKDVKYEND